MSHGKKIKYMRRVFSGKRVPMIGLDQGKSKLYRGNGVQNVFNVYYDSSMALRDGEIAEAAYDGGINTGAKFLTSRVICSGTNIYVKV